MRAKTKDELELGDEIVSVEKIKNGRRLTINVVTEITAQDVIVDDFYDIAPNEDEQYIVLPKLL